MAEEFQKNVTGAILAGGLSRRMKGIDKGLLQLNNKPLLEYAIEKIRPQTSNIFINTNTHITEYEQFGFQIVEDDIQGYPGPLAGISACLKLANTEFILCVPCDSPLLPDNLGANLYQVMKQHSADIAYSHDGTRAQPLFALIKCKLAASASEYLMSGHNKVETWYKQHKAIECDFSDQAVKFLNINSEQDLQKASNIHIE